MNTKVERNGSDILQCRVTVVNRQWATRKEKRKGLAPPFPISAQLEGSLTLKAKDNRLQMIFSNDGDYTQALTIFNCLVVELKNSLSTSF